VSHRWDTSGDRLKRVRVMGWQCEVCGGMTSDARVFYDHNGKEVKVHPYPYRAVSKLFMCEFTAKHVYGFSDQPKISKRLED
jgi:hypothetical protein